MQVHEVGFNAEDDTTRFRIWVCDLIEDTYGLVAEPMFIQIADEDSHRLTVYYGARPEGMPVGWILPGRTQFMFGVIFDAVNRG